MGTADREVYFDADVAETFAETVAALEQVGNVDRSSDRTKTASAVVRAGLQRARLRISVVPHEGGSLIRVSGSSDDVWGFGARKATDKLIRALG